MSEQGEKPLCQRKSNSIQLMPLLVVGTDIVQHWSRLRHELLVGCEERQRNNLEEAHL